MPKKKIKKQPKLSAKHVRHLRGLGHHLNPLAMVGREGITETLVDSVDQVLTAHELVKIKVQNTASLEPEEAAEALTQQTGSALVQVLGKTMLLFRENKDRKADERIILPK